MKYHYITTIYLSCTSKLNKLRINFELEPKILQVHCKGDRVTEVILESFNLSS